MSEHFTFKPLTSAEWPDFVALFEEHGPQNGCWCMYWRARRADVHRHFGEGNKMAFKQILDSGKIPGILAYLGGKPVGWCSVAPREDFPVLDRSRTLQRVDDQPVWSIVCFFISKPYRRQRITTVLLKAAIQYAKDNGAKIVEAYPLKNEIAKDWPFERYMGIESTFEKAGFKVALRKSDRRPVMRYYLFPETQ